MVGGSDVLRVVYCMLSYMISDTYYVLCSLVVERLAFYPPLTTFTFQVESSIVNIIEPGNHGSIVTRGAIEPLATPLVNVFE